MAREKALMGIYCIKNTLNNKVYVGQSVDIEARIATHFVNADTGRKTSHLYNAINKYGREHFEPSILCITPDRTLLNELEYKWIIALDACNREKGYNIRIENGTTYVHSDETKQKMSDAAIGKVFTDSHKANIRTKYKKGHNVDPYVLQKRTDAIRLAWKEGRHSGNTSATSTSFKKGHVPHNLGKTFSDETKAKQRAAKLGKSQTPEHVRSRIEGKGYKPICQFTLSLQLIATFDSFQDIISTYGNKYLQPGIHSCCNGNKPFYKDSIFKYKQDIVLIENEGFTTFHYTTDDIPVPIELIRQPKVYNSTSKVKVTFNPFKKI